MRFAGGDELALGQAARGLGVACAGGRLLGGLLRPLALAVLVVDQPLAVGARALGVLARAVALLAHARQLVGADGRRAERGLELAPLLGRAEQLLADALELRRRARLGRPGLRGGSARQRQVDDQLAADLQLGALGVELAAVPLEGGDPRIAVVGGPWLVVEHGHQPAAALAACSHSTGRTKRRPRSPCQWPTTSRRSPAAAKRSTTNAGSVAVLSVIVAIPAAPG